MIKFCRKLSVFIIHLVSGCAGLFPQLQRFAKDARGVSAVEFALLLPVMVLIYGGVVDLSRGVETDKKVNRVASVVGDLVSRQVTVKVSELNDIFKIGATTMVPSATSPEIKVSFLQIENTPVGGLLPAKVLWSYATSGLTRDPVNSRITIPNDLRLATLTYIRVEVQYKYTPFMAYVIPPLNLSEIYYISPRYTDEITCTGC